MEEITTDEAATRLRIKASRVRQLILAGRLQARHINPRCLLVSAKSVAEFQRLPRGRPKNSLKTRGKLKSKKS